MQKLRDEDSILAHVSMLKTVGRAYDLEDLF